MIMGAVPVGVAEHLPNADTVDQGRRLAIQWTADL